MKNMKALIISLGLGIVVAAGVAVSVPSEGNAASCASCSRDDGWVYHCNPEEESTYYPNGCCAGYHVSCKDCNDESTRDCNQD